MLSVNAEAMAGTEPAVVIPVAGCFTAGGPTDTKSLRGLLKKGYRCDPCRLPA
jgi:hypothetical protein